MADVNNKEDGDGLNHPNLHDAKHGDHTRHIRYDADNDVFGNEENHQVRRGVPRRIFPLL
jgi:hypothetical protein